jgi:hypothetical protein
MDDAKSDAPKVEDDNSEKDEEVEDDNSVIFIALYSLLILFFFSLLILLCIRSTSGIFFAAFSRWDWWDRIFPKLLIICYSVYTNL